MTEATWLNTRERGTILGVRFAFAAATLFGRTATKPLVALVALWYRLFDRPVVRASRRFLARATGREPGFLDVYRHIRTFAQVTVDRIFLLRGTTAAFAFTRTGNEHLLAHGAAGTGAVLLGAHLGSYEAMRASGDDEAMAINILGYFENARMVNALFERLNPGQAARVIHLGRDPVSAMVTARERLAAGELVALLGDRVGLNDRTVEAEFLGAKAPFAAGPFLMAALLKAPVYLVFGLYRAPNRYDLVCEPFCDRVELPRRGRDEALAALVQRYADRLAEYARRSPDNWFNFFDFWRGA